MPKETVIPKDLAAAVKDIKLAILQARAKAAHLVRQMPSAEIRPMPYDFRVILKRPVTEPNVEKTMVKTRVETSGLAR